MCINKSTDLCEIAKVLSRKCVDNSKSITVPCLMMGEGMLNTIQGQILPPFSLN